MENRTWIRLLFYVALLGLAALVIPTTVKAVASIIPDITKMVLLIVVLTLGYRVLLKR